MMICPQCDKDIVPEVYNELRRYIYCNKYVLIADRFFRCPECRGEWSVDKFDFAAEVYKKYDQMSK